MSKNWSPLNVRKLGLASSIGVAVFTVVCTLAQFLRGDLNWTHAPLSFYLNGPAGWAVKIAYVALSASLVGIGVGFHRSLDAGWRGWAPLLLFMTAGIALTVTALSDVAKKHGEVSPHHRIHIIAAATTFVSVTVAMLLQSLLLRQDARWRSRSGFAFALAAAAFLALCFYGFVHVRSMAFVQKTVIALILAWLGWAALALWRKATR